MSDRAGDWTAKLRIHPSAFVAPGAVVVGDVSLGARSSVWFNTVVRGDTDRIEIGDDSNVQDNSTVHVDHGEPAIVGARVTIGHRAIIHGCQIADDCLIGMGSVVLSGARLGAGCLVGAASLVREKQVVPPGSLVLGSPARVLGPVSETHRGAIRHGASHYAELAASYVARGFARPHPPASSDLGASAAAARAMTHEEWARLVRALRETAGWMGDRLEDSGESRFRAPGPGGGWSAHEVMCHVRDGDARVFAPRLETLLRSSGSPIAYVDLTSHAEGKAYLLEPSKEALAGFAAARAALASRLEPLGPPDWSAWGVHDRLGPMSLSDMVRGWLEHDLSHRRQLARALAENA